MLVRDTPCDTSKDSPEPDLGTLEVLMVRRNLRSDFVGGAYVFPGGGLDPSDYSESAASISPGRSDSEASSLLGLVSGGLAYWVAVLRECFEEAGLLLAYRSKLPDKNAALISLTDPTKQAHFDRLRCALNSKEKSFVKLCADEHLLLAVERVYYFAHWITPAGAPRRYDTRFFVARAPVDQRPTNDAGETIDEVWINPLEALRQHREGQIELIFPTIRNLQAISRFSSSEELIDAAAKAESSVSLVEPRVVADGNGVRILLPGDPGYDDIAADDAPSSPATFNEVVREISKDANR